jgi:hypothetical protein
VANSKKANFLPFHLAHIQLVGVVGGDQGAGFLHTLRDAEAPGDIVFRAGRNDAEVNLAADHAAHHGFEGSVATHGDHGLISVLNGAPGNRCCLFFGFRQSHICLDAQLFQA